ncbi:MAG: hypothetical protein B6I20_11360 [Bacteroidetes bacterium 4572_117]|nr:MAG: hypothetical protein B6I20_11360 [Bacteroidetes bacterium 4572_117]
MVIFIWIVVCAMCVVMPIILWKISLSFLDYIEMNLNSHGIRLLNIKYSLFSKKELKIIITNIVKLKKHGVECTFNDAYKLYVNEYKVYEKEFDKEFIPFFNEITDYLLEAKLIGLTIKFYEISDIMRYGGDIEKNINAWKTNKKYNLGLTKKNIQTWEQHKNDIDILMKQVIHAKQVNIDIDWEEFIRENISADAFEKIIDIIINISKVGLFASKNQILEDETLKAEKITQTGLLKHYASGIDVESYAKAMILAKKTKIPIGKKALDIHFMTQGNMEKLVSSFLKAEKAKIDISAEDTLKHGFKGEDLGRIINVAIKAKQKNYKISFNDLINFKRLKLEPEEVLKAVSVLTDLGMQADNEMINSIHLQGIDVYKYALALRLGRVFNVSKDNIDDHYLKGGNALNVLIAIAKAKSTNFDIDVGQAYFYDLIGKLNEIVEACITPNMQLVKPEISVISKDGYQISPKINVTTKGKFSIYTKGTNEEVLFHRINEAFIDEVLKHDSYKKILENLENISDKVLQRLQARAKVEKHGLNEFELEDENEIVNKREQKLNDSSALEAIDITVFDITINGMTPLDFSVHHHKHDKEIQEIESSIRKIKATAAEAEAKVGILQSQSKLKEGIAEGFRNNTLSYKEYMNRINVFGPIDNEIDTETDTRKHPNTEPPPEPEEH